MSEKKQRYTPEQIAEINRQSSAQQEQVIRLQAQFENLSQQLDELKNKARDQFGVKSLNELRQLAESEQERLNKDVKEVLEIISMRQKIIDTVSQKLSDLTNES